MAPAASVLRSGVGDADTTGAIAGQIAGAHSGAAGIPPAWRATLAHAEPIVGYADRRLERALRRIAAA